MHDIDEALGLAVAPLQVALDQFLHHGRHFRARERRTEHAAERRLRAGPRLALVAADFDLVPLLAVLVDAEDADVTDMVVPAGIHAAGDIEIELADVMHVIEVIEALLDRLRHRNRLGVGKRAEVAAGAGNDVGE